MPQFFRYLLIGAILFTSSTVFAMEKDGFTVKKTLSFAYQTVDIDLESANETIKKDLVLFGVRGELAIKLVDKPKHAWFGGFSAAVLKGEVDADMVTGGLISNGSGDVDSAFEFDGFAESNYLLSPRFSFLTRLGLNATIVNGGEISSDLGGAQQAAEKSGDGTLELFLALGASYAWSDKSSISALLRITGASLTSWTDTNNYDVEDFNVIGLQVNYSF